MAEFWNIDRLDLWKGLAVRTAVFKSARICSLGFDQYGTIIRVIDQIRTTKRTSYLSSGTFNRLKNYFKV